MPASNRRNAPTPRRRNTRILGRQGGTTSPADPADTQPRTRRRATPAGLLWSVTLALAHALMFLCAFPPIGLWPLALLAPAPLAWLALTARSARSAFFLTLIVQFLMWLWIDRWLIDVTIAGYPLKALYMSLYGCAFVWLMRRLHRHPRFARWPAALTLPLAWVALECLRGELVFDGYPWFLLGHPLVEAPACAQSADLLGVYLLSFLAAAAAGAVVDLAPAARRRIPAPAAVIALAAVLLLHAANIAYGAWRLRQPAHDLQTVNLLAIQTNLPQSNKIAWSLDDQRRDLAAFIALTRTAAHSLPTPPDLIVWPETMLPVRGLERPTLQTLRKWGQHDELDFARQVFQLQRELRVPLLVGVPCHLGLDVSPQGRWIWNRNYNSAYLIRDPDPLQRYDKHFLTPFGEVMPYISKWPWLERKLLAIGAPGMSFSLDGNPTINRLTLSLGRRVITLATPICFEDTVARVCRRMVYHHGRKQAQLLVNLSNDGWFGSSDAGRAQHVQIARLRCIENRVPMVRCANTGMSVSIDSAGRVVGTIGDARYGNGRRSGWLAATPRLDDRASLYGRLGEIFPWTCLLASFLGLCSTFLGRRKGSP